VSKSAPEFVKLFAYGRWANDKTLGAVAALSAEEYVRSVGGSFGSVQGTLAHLYGADWVWLERWHGRSPKSLPPAAEVPTLEVLKEKWPRVQAGHKDFVGGLTEGRLAEPITYVNFQGKTFTYSLSEALTHMVNHGTYHRGQVMTLLRQLGKPAVSTDFLRYIDAGSPP